MKTIKNAIIALALVLFVGNIATAQKFGYLNSSQLLVELPEVKKADEDLVAYQKTLITKGEQMVKAFEVKYKALSEQAAKGELSQLVMQGKEAELKGEQEAIQKYEYEIQQMMAQRRQELYQPILDKVKTVLDGIGKEMGYTMIFDTSGGGILHAAEGDDMMPIMKQKLGL